MTRQRTDRTEGSRAALPGGSPFRYALAIGLTLGILESSKALVVGRLRGVPDFDPGRALLMNMPWWLLWVALAPAVFWLADRAPFREGVGRALTVHAVGCTVLSMLHLGASSVLVWAVAVPPPGYTNTIREQFEFLVAGYLLTDVLTYGAILAAYGVLTSRQQVRAAEEERTRLELVAANSETEKARLEALMVDARLRALRSELDPHFLFNSLNSIAALSQRGDNEGAVSMIARLGELLRITIDGRDDPEVTVKEEVELLRFYLEIEEVRFGDRLRTGIAVEPAVERALVPSLILQPLVENALRHGVAVIRGPVEVGVDARSCGDRLTLVVRDSGPGPGPRGGVGGDGTSSSGSSRRGSHEAPRGGLGLRNARERLETLYGDAASLELRARPGGGTEASITLPLRIAEGAEVVV